MTIRKSKAGGFMATCTHRTKDGPVQVAGFSPNRIDAVAKCCELRRLLIEKENPNARET